MAIQIDNDTAIDALDAVTALANTGYLRIYDGSMPAECTTANPGNLLLEFTLHNPAFDAAVDGTGKATATLDVAPALTDDGLFAATATYARVYASNGTTCLWQDDGIGTSITLSDTSIEVGQEFTVTSYVLEMPES